MLNLHHDEKNNYYIPGVQAVKGEVAGSGVGGGGEVLLQHEMKAYVTTIFVINMRNGNILWEDFIINEFKRQSVHHGEMTEELPHSGKLLMNNLILKVIINGKQSHFV